MANYAFEFRSSRFVKAFKRVIFAASLFSSISTSSSIN
ncbi:hypothetical protein PG5_00430 [Pseudomonas sp. G5(2012)]|nr:hypothetical protein PG5_00430 [Pseudomonas sp. G5(2012)]